MIDQDNKRIDIILDKISKSGYENLSEDNPRLQVRNVEEYIEIMKNLNLKKPAEIFINSILAILLLFSYSLQFLHI